MAGRLLTDAPFKLTCSSCGNVFKTNRSHRSRWRREGQRTFYCSRDCYKQNRGEVKNPRAFKSIDTEEKAYWLGYFVGDGNVQSGCRQRVYLGSTYYSVPESFKIFLGASHSITTHNHNPKPYYRIAVENEDLVADLKSHGVGPKKTFETRMPKSVPQHLVRHFIRGLLDAEGFISLCRQTESKHRNLQVSLYGSYGLMVDVKDYLDSEFPEGGCKVTKAATIYSVRKSGWRAQKIAEYLYEDASIYLEYKKLKLDQFIEERGER